ncbi:MaoC family dehydratase N-terminal domain-containing protein [Streptomyces sp. NPDC058424]|uniref:FAS1-like dehydratase domain-containing protein n=1 Tax=Streptomyces sp. NPDC058424 TaxID=3346491 RepID=UPI003662F92C
MPRQLRPVPVTAVEIAKYAYTVGADDPVHFDREAARERGHADVVAALGFHMVLRHACPNLTPLSQFEEDGGRDDLTPPNTARRRMAGESRARFHAPIVAGDSMTLTKRITDLAEKQGRSGPLATVTYTLEFRARSGIPLVTEEYVRILR